MSRKRKMTFLAIRSSTKTPTLFGSQHRQRVPSEICFAQVLNQISTISAPVEASSSAGCRATSQWTLSSRHLVSYVSVKACGPRHYHARSGQSVKQYYWNYRLRHCTFLLCSSCKNRSLALNVFAVSQLPTSSGRTTIH